MLSGTWATTAMSSLPPPSGFAKLKKWFREHRVALFLEGTHPLLLGTAAAIAVWWSVLTEDQVSKLLEDVLPTAVTVATVLAGFQATAQSVLIALIDSPAWRYLQRLKHDHRLVNYHWETIVSLLVFVGISLGILIAKAVGVPVEKSVNVVPAVLAASLVHAALCSVRIARLMVVLLRQKDQGGT